MRTETDTNEWRTDFPDKSGWYDCRIDGEEMRLYLFVCELNPKRRYWNDDHGTRVWDEVEWRN